MDPTFPDIVGAWAEQETKARAWTVTRGEDGRLEERLDRSFLMDADDVDLPDEVIEALIATAARQDIEHSRVW